MLKGIQWSPRGAQIFEELCAIMAWDARVAQLGFMWGARVPGWDGLGTISDPKMEIEGHKTEISELEKTFRDKVFQDYDLMATDCVQEVMIQTS